MKSILTVLFSLALCRSLLAGDPPAASRASTPTQKDQPAACCAAEEKIKPASCCADAKPKAAACCADEKTDKAACCAQKSAAPAACCAKEAKPACCAPAGAPQPAACCAGEAPAAPAKKDACCAEIENRESRIENLTADSLYQLDATFTADNGQPFALASLRGRPVVLTMFFASCGYACPMLVTDMHAIRAKLPAEIRDRAALVLVSFDVERDTPAALKKYRDERHLDAQWVLLHGDDASVRELAALLGVKFVREADGNFAHSNLITVLNGEGEVVHQRNGLRGGLDETAAAIAAVR